MVLVLVLLALVSYDTWLNGLNTDVDAATAAAAAAATVRQQQRESPSLNLVLMEPLWPVQPGSSTEDRQLALPPEYYSNDVLVLVASANDNYAISWLSDHMHHSYFYVVVCVDSSTTTNALNLCSPLVATSYFVDNLVAFVQPNERSKVADELLRYRSIITGAQLEHGQGYQPARTRMLVVPVHSERQLAAVVSDVIALLPLPSSRHRTRVLAGTRRLMAQLEKSPNLKIYLNGTLE
jgi:hypothetical protein